MWFWWLMLACNIIIPIFTVIAGWFMWQHAPKKINSIIGYRTKRSMKNDDTWNFAHKFCGKLWWVIGWIILGASIVVLIPFIFSSYITIGVTVIICVVAQCAILIISIIPTDIALKKTFFDDGKRH